MMTAFLNGKVMLLSNKQRKLKVTYIMATLHKKKKQFPSSDGKTKLSLFTIRTLSCLVTKRIENAFSIVGICESECFLLIFYG